MGAQHGGPITDKKRKEVMTPAFKVKLNELFDELDTDGSNELERDEVIAKFQGSNGQNNEAEKFFRAIDADGSGIITRGEFEDFWT